MPTKLCLPRQLYGGAAPGFVAGVTQFNVQLGTVTTPPTTATAAFNVSGGNFQQLQRFSGGLDRALTLVLLLLQIAVILAVCRLLHEACERIGQPPVIGEIIAGLLLGPSLFGWLAPNLFAKLFPLSSLPALNALSQIGLVLFMFLVGLHLDLGEVWSLRRVAGLAGLLSIAVPFGAGFALARPLHELAPSATMLPFSLFVAVAMSITAFPVLARILADHKLSATRLGHVAIACAAFNDVVAWSLLAWIVAVSRSAQKLPLSNRSSSWWFIPRRCGSPCDRYCASSRTNWRAC